MSAATHFGWSIQIISTIAPAIAPIQTTTRIASASGPWRTSSANGV